MGLAVPDDEDSPSPPPQQSADVLEWQARLMAAEAQHAAEREKEAREQGQGDGGDGAKSPRGDDSLKSPGACSPRSTEASSPEGKHLASFYLSVVLGKTTTILFQWQSYGRGTKLAFFLNTSQNFHKRFKKRSKISE